MVVAVKKRFADMDFGARGPIMVGYEKHDAATNMALDEAMLKFSVVSGKTFIRFYEFDKPTIILSSSDHADNIRVENLDGIDVTRRESGGKTIYLDDKVISYSISGRFDERFGADLDIKSKIHRFFGGAVCNAIKSMVDNPEFVDMGSWYSIKIDGKPVAGHAQRIQLASKSFLYHGVVAIGSWDAEKIKALIRISEADYEEIGKLPSILGSIDKKSGDLGYYKNLFVIETLHQVSDGKIEGIDDSDRSEILKIASKLLVEKYKKIEWVYNRDEKLSREAKFCLINLGLLNL